MSRFILRKPGSIQAGCTGVALMCAMVLILCLGHALAQETQEGDVWTGMLADGTVITEQDLSEILKQYKKWIKCKQWEEAKAKLPGEYSPEHSPCKGESSEAIPHISNLRGAYLRWADMHGAALSELDLSDADLYGANVYNADLRKAFLNGTILSSADMNGTTLVGATLLKAYLEDTKLKWAGLEETNLNEAILHKANLYGARLNQAKLNGVNLSEADLTEADLSGADLTGADLSGAKLGLCKLWYADLKDTRLWGSEMFGATYEAKPSSLPFVPDIASVKGLDTLNYGTSPHALMELREAAKKAGMRDQERQITTSIKRWDNEIKWNSAYFLRKVESLFNYLFFDLTSEYGLYPGRPLWIIIAGILILSLPYTLAIVFSTGRGGIWAVWQSDRVEKSVGGDEPVRLRLQDCLKRLPERGAKRLWGKANCLLRAFGYGLYFSLISACSIGWRDLNVGNWISRIQRREYNLKPTGWARTVSGLQSVVSAYLLALSVLTYFGRPFE
jgi:uncharacterized protein YjbI with pentapeptide repeats